jgi:hypothetical protein
MTIARAHLVDPAVTRWYHCVTRCVRRAFLLGEGMHDRKGWIEHRLEELAEIFSVAVAGFAILDNHLHLLVRLDPEAAWGWSDEDVVRRWGRLFPPRDKARQVAPVSDEWVQARLKDARWVATARERLQSLSWFMKCLKSTGGPAGTFGGLATTSCGTTTPTGTIETAAVIDQTTPNTSVGTIPITMTIKVTDALGNNVSASSLPAVSMSAVGSNGNLVPQAAPGNSNPGNPFTFDPTTGTYRFNLKTKGYKLGA